MASPIGGHGGQERQSVSVVVDVYPYDPILGIGTWWNDDAVIGVEIHETPETTVVISGNPAGLTSLARHLLTLAQDSVPDGRHLDFDTYSGWLGDGSAAIRIEVEKEPR